MLRPDEWWFTIALLGLIYGFAYLPGIVARRVGGSGGAGASSDAGGETNSVK